MEQMIVQCYSQVCFHHSRRIILSSNSQQKKCKVLGRSLTFANVHTFYTFCKRMVHLCSSFAIFPITNNYQLLKCNITSLRRYFAIFPTCAKLLDFRVSWTKAVVHPSKHVMPGWYVIMMIMVKMMIVVMMMMIWLPNDGYFRKHVMPGW